VTLTPIRRTSFSDISQAVTVETSLTKRLVFRIASLEAEEKVCRKGQLEKRGKILLRVDETPQTGKLWRVEGPRSERPWLSA
jgi:hypothetical protein